MSRIVKKRIYKVIFQLKSPLSIGSGSNNRTDRDIIRNSRGIPYIPGSALAGIGREIAGKIFDVSLDGQEEKKSEQEKRYFGDISGNDDNPNIPSRIVFYDGNIKGNICYISNRDGVKLDEWKTAIPGHKFDMEILEPGIEIVTYVEQNYYDMEDEDIAGQIIQHWLHHTIYMGAKTMRGYGAVETESAFVKEFDMTNAGSLNSWLEFDMYGDSWNAQKDSILVEDEGNRTADGIELKLKLKQAGGIFIRRYTTQVSEQKDKVLPDYEQLTVHVGGKEYPIIPGTSWAGAFRHRMSLLDAKCNREDLWGTAETKKKSSIRFSETVLENAKAKQVSRNSIDRFSGGTVDKALFTEKTYYGGETELIISLDKAVDDTVKRTLAAAIADLHYGFLAVGGLTAVGRGLFKVESINAEPILDDIDTIPVSNDVYMVALKALETNGRKE